MPKATVTNVDALPANLNMDEVRQFLRISRPKAYELANTSGFPAVRIGRAIRVPREALLRWLEEQTGYTT
jgi:excisionase family DNA binding protein